MHAMNFKLADPLAIWGGQNWADKVNKSSYRLQCRIHKHVCWPTAVTNANVWLQPHLIGLDVPDSYACVLQLCCGSVES